MDVDDPSGSDNFYDEIDSLMPPPGDFNLDDIDEILRATNPELDATFGFNNFDAPNELFNFNIKNEFMPPPTTSLSSSAATETITFGSNTNLNITNFFENIDDDTTKQARSTSLSSGMDDGDDNFNPDEFMNFLNDDSIKFEELNGGDSDCSNNSIEDALQRQRHRNTPSPTGSCSSSGGSSTSGIQSDASSVGSMTPAYNMNQTMDLIKMTHLESNFMEHEATTINVSIPATAVTAPTQLLTANLVQQIQQMPVQTINVSNAAYNTTLPAPIKIEAKLASKQLNTATATPTVKIVPATSVTNNSTTGISASKITPPTNAKPKTIFLSSNDFKTLMQRMNTNGSAKVANGGAKITGAINAQMPKIIMKTPNGKVITTNKIVQPLNGGVVNSKSVLSKVVTANGAQMVLKQQQQQHQQVHSKLDSNSNSSNSTGCYKGMIDEKIFKKQQRMIKNRESASLSRKKKKEYVVSLENRINNLEKENYTLKGDNKSLRSQLVALAQTCRCKNGNVSEFILKSLNAAEQKSQPVKIAPKPAAGGKSLKQRMSAATIRKNVAVLFAMAFMVSLNVGNFQNFLNKNAIEESGMSEQTAEEPLSQVATASAGRRLLWVESEAEYNEKLNRSKRETKNEIPPPPPPLHFLRPINRTGAGAGLGVGGNSTQTQHESAKTTTTTIGMNQTENLRLASNLRKWIGGNANYLNLSLNEQYNNYLDEDLENPTGFRASADYYDMKSYDLPLQHGNGPGPVPVAGQQQKRKLFAANEEKEGLRTVGVNGKQRKLANELDNSLEIFKPKISDEYLRLFKGIKRQDDTFYVLSFNMDHLLLPAANYNKSSRPKMALMLPAGDPALNGDVTLMQIDCEVTNTTELMLKSFMIPEKLRPNTFSKNPNDVVNNETAAAGGGSSGSGGGGGGGGEGGNPTQKPKESRFFRQAEDLEASKRPVIEKLVTKQKPVVRTFYLMGPKTQAAADAAKKKPTIIKLSGNETFANGGVLNVKNSTLFTKMRDTVGP